MYGIIVKNLCVNAFRECEAKEGAVFALRMVVKRVCYWLRARIASKSKFRWSDVDYISLVDDHHYDGNNDNHEDLLTQYETR